MQDTTPKFWVSCDVLSFPVKRNDPYHLTVAIWGEDELKDRHKPEIANFLSKQTPTQAAITGVSLFGENKDSLVFTCQVDSTLTSLGTLLKSKYNASLKFPEFKPHITIIDKVNQVEAQKLVNELNTFVKDNNTLLRKVSLGKPKLKLGQLPMITLDDWLSGESKKVFSVNDGFRIGKLVGVDWDKVDFSVEQFTKGMNVELEHGTRFPDANITDNDPILTGKIALAHLFEDKNYYTKLESIESH